jgi:hypothetical protein
VRFLLAGLALVLASCGYHTAGHGDLIPKTIHTICIPAFKNASSRYKLSDHLPEAIAREFISRTKYQISTDLNTCDAILRGQVINFLANQTVVDEKTGRAVAADLHVILNISFTERATGKVLYNNPNFDQRERYEISEDPIAYFEESDAGLNRVATQLARKVVSEILNVF